MQPLCNYIKHTRNVLAVFKIPVMPMASCLLPCQSQLKSHFVRLLRTRISKLHLDEAVATKTKHPSCWACTILHNIHIYHIYLLSRVFPCRAKTDRNANFQQTRAHANEMLHVCSHHSTLCSSTFMKLCMADVQVAYFFIRQKRGWMRFSKSIRKLNLRARVKCCARVQKRRVAKDESGKAAPEWRPANRRGCDVSADVAVRIRFGRLESACVKRVVVAKSYCGQPANRHALT